MKNRIASFLLLLVFVGHSAAAASVDAPTRREITATLSRIVNREVSGANVKIQAIKASKKKVLIYTSVGLSYYPFREENTAAMRDSVRRLLPSAFRKADILIYSDTREIAELIPMAYRNAAAAKNLVPFTNTAPQPLVTRLSAAEVATKGLVGRHIALWQSHGRYFDQPKNRWKWQRSQLWETCEDLYTQSYVLPYLVPMLENAGANVLLPRERDVQKHEVVADNDVPAQYREQGAGWSNGGRGFAQLRQVYHTGENPFREGTTRRIRTVTGESTARAVWSADIPEAGEYAVYVSYESTAESAVDANYTVRHLGQQSIFAVNQTMGGGTWIYLGKFAFAAGQQEVVTLSNSSRTAGRIVSADAVKIGGGFGNVARSVDAELRHPGVEYADETSGYPRFCEGARYWLQWAGFDEKVYTPKQNLDDYKDDYMSRAHWVNALMGGSQRLPDSTGLHIPLDMALAFHSDAGVRDGDGIIGTLGIYFTRDNRGHFVGGADRYRSRDLTDIVMTQVVSDIRRTWESEWSRRGLWNRSYYEARVPCVPTMLLELLSHQNFADMRYGSDPRFKFTVSRAIYKGILQYISSQYRTPYVVQPLPVKAFSITLEGENSVRLQWTPVVDSLETTATPDRYIVYTRIDDGGFDNGQVVAEPTWVAMQEPGRLYSYKVTAINAGGESFPSETLSACRVSGEKGRVLVINGFDRISAPMSMHSDSLAGFRNDLDGGVPDRQDISFIGSQKVFDLSQARCEVDSIALGACNCDYETDILGGNTFDYPALHGHSIAAAGYSFCSASVRAVERNEVELTDYTAVDLILGKQRATRIGRGTAEPEFRTFTPELQQALRRYLALGGAAFVSGSYVATDLWTGDGASAESQAFAREVLHYAFDCGHAAQQGRVRIVAAQPLFSRGEYRFVDAPEANRYAVEAPDALKPADNGAFPVMRYIDNNRIAAIGYEGESRTLVAGFPFEALSDGRQRDRLMANILDFLSKTTK